ncbi:MAG TPA: four-carbon acid sugar kinase family protein [Streptosporangiaceae bacterium]|jgi:uncharacterized protein YgbK (DUF1537 family)
MTANTGPLDIGVLADDLTGAHASAARLRAAGHRARVVWRPLPPPASVTALVADMRTRDYGVDPYGMARSWTAHLRALGVRRIELRIDSTLRGTPDTELAGVLDALGEASAAPATVLCVPAFPSAGRTVRDGILHVPDVDLPAERRDVAARVFGARAVGAVRLGLSDVRAGRLAGHVIGLAEGGARLFVADAETDDDLRRLAAMADRAEHVLPGPFVTVSPGAWLGFRSAPERDRFTLVVLSSDTPVNRTQLDVLTRDRRCAVHNARDLLGGRGPVDVPPDVRVVVVETLSAAARDDADTWLLSTLAARAAGLLLDTAGGGRCAGVVCGGGQTASALMDTLGADHLDVRGEPAPLCPMSAIGSGPYAGLPIVTKGGLVGGPATLRDLVAVLDTPAHDEGDHR